jgi:mannitol/fructose-specific phosphotransferase system IIA component (Ntr-type)
MTVSKVLSEAIVRLDLPSGDLTQAIEGLGKALGVAEGVGDPQGAVAELVGRGRRQAVPFDNEVAIVHTVTQAAESLTLALGRSPAGLTVPGHARPMVHFVCLLLIPSGERVAGFRLLNALAVLLRDPMVRTQLLWAETVEEVVAICAKAEGGRWTTMSAWLKDRVRAAIRPSAATGTASGESA